MPAATILATPGAPRLALPTPPGAKVVALDGRAATAHYGSVATEVAVCRKAVGLAVRSELRILELSAAPARLERALARTLGGRVPEVGSAAAAGGTWCCRLDAGRALVVGAPGAVERWRRVVRDATIGGGSIAVTELTDDWAAVSLVGPKAATLLARSGLPADLPLGGVHQDALAGAGAVLLRIGPDHWLALLDGAGAPGACRGLLDAGRSLGLTLVGCEAIGRLAAAARSALAPV